MIESKSELLNVYQNETGKNPMFKNGKIKGSFLKWNKKKLRNKQTRIYYEYGKFFNPVTNRIIKVKYDKRFKRQTLTSSFLKKYQVEQGLVVPRNNDVYEFDVVPNHYDQLVVFNTEHNLNNSLLLQYLIRDYEIFGDYRLIITGFANGQKVELIDNSYTIETARRFWSEHEMDFKVDSPHYLWNQEDFNGNIIWDKVKFYFTKETFLSYNYYQQSFRDGVSHCVFQPMLDYFTEKMNSVTTKTTKGNYLAKINLIKGKDRKIFGRKDGLIEKYANGVPESKLESVCEELQIGIDIEQPFASKTKNMVGTEN